MDSGPSMNTTILRSSFADCMTTGPAIYRLGGGIAVRAPYGTITLDGCTFERCRSGRGGGIALQRVGESQSTAAIENCAFRGNSASRDVGGAIASSWLSTSIRGSTFEDNAVDTGLGSAYGGAAYLTSANFLIENSTFRRNSALANSASAFERTAWGGAAFIDASTCTVRGSTFDSNIAESVGGTTGGNAAGRRAEGGALHIFNSAAVLDNTAFTANRASGLSTAVGGALKFSVTYSTFPLTISRCGFTSNTASMAPDSRGGAAAWNGLSAPAGINDCNFTLNQAARGAALMCWNVGAALELCRLERNLALAPAGVVESESGAESSFRNTIICGSGTNWATGPMADLGGNTVSAACTDCNSNGIEDSTEIANGSAPDCNANGIPDICDILSGVERDSNLNDRPDRCDADLSGDGIVGGADLTILLNNWGATGANPADLDRNGVVSASDLTFLLVNWI